MRVFWIRVVITLILAFIFATNSMNYVSAQNAGNLTETQGGSVNWAEGTVYAIGHGRIPNSNEQGVEDLARQAAIMDAYRHLVGAVQGVRVDSDSLMEMLLLKKDTVRTQVAGVVKASKIIAEGTLPNGSYYVKIIAPLYGVNSVAAAVLPEVMPTAPIPFPAPSDSNTTLPKSEVEKIKITGYSGVVIDASSLNLEPAMSPIIYDTNDRAIYGAKNIDVDFAIANDMVSYSKTVTGSNVTSRVGDNALVVKAVSVKGGSNSVNKVNVVISVEDADKILIANQTSNFLKKCAVVFVR